MFVDGDFVGQAQYGFPRADVGDQYPQIANSRNSGWRFVMDTRLLANSIHRLTIRTRDNGGRVSEVASTDFYVLNNDPQITRSPSDLDKPIE